MDTNNIGQSVINLIDDDEDYLALLYAFIKTLGYPVHSYNGPKNFLDTYQGQAGCLVLDLRMPRTSGLELQKSLNNRGSKLPVIFLSAYGEVESVVSAMKAGAFDFLTKPFKQEQFIDVVNKAVKHSEKQAEFRKSHNEFIVKVATLTPKEREVMYLMIEGKTTKEIAKQLNVSKNTIDLHRAKVMKKVETNSLVELVNLLHKYNLTKNFR